MGVNTIEPKGNLAASSRRGPSYSLWADVPVMDFIEDPGLGMYFFDDFLVSGNADMTSAFKNSIGQWSAYGYAGALLSDGALEGGVLTMGSNDDDEGVTLESSTGAFRTTTTSTLVLNQKLVFECRIARSTITATKIDAFVGLCTPSLSSNLPAAGLPISTTIDTLSTTPSLLGFMSKGSVGNEWSFVYQLASGTAVFPTGLTTLMNTVTAAALTANQFVKLGFVFDPNAAPLTIATASTGQTAGQIARPILKVFVNGMPAAAFLTSVNCAGAAFPTGFMSPCISVMNNAGTSPGTVSIDWLRVAQYGNS